jgi:hypothetical protein
VPWEQATRAEARDFCCWLQVADKPRRGHWRRPDAEPPAAPRAAPNPVTGKLPPGPKLAPATVAHCESVVAGLGIAIGAVFATALTAYPAYALITTWQMLVSRGGPRLMTLMNEARERDLLRREGAVSQFRHAAIQEYLAGPGDGLDQSY